MVILSETEDCNQCLRSEFSGTIRGHCSWIKTAEIMIQIWLKSALRDEINHRLIYLATFKHTCGLDYLFVILDAVLAAEAFLLAINQQEVIGSSPVRQIVTTLLTAVYDQPIGPAVNVKTRIAADLVGYSLKANLMPDLQP